MSRGYPRLRFLGPVALTSLILLALCSLMAFLLYRQQSSASEDLRENVGSRRAASDLEETLNDLHALLRGRNAGADSLHDRVDKHLREIGRYADKEREVELADKLAASFDAYRLVWAEIPAQPGPARDRAFDRAAVIIETKTLPRCRDLRDYNARLIEQSELAHRVVVRRLAWGLVGVGGAGAVAGLVLGYGVARGLHRSIGRLQFHVQDAAGKLGQDFPAIVLTEEGDLEQLHEQVEALTRQIEQVVDRLRQREREVLRAEQLAAVGQVAASVAHEVRNPLTGIKMLVQGALEGGSLSGEALQVIEQEIRRMERSLKTFLDFARPPRLERSTFDLAVLVDQTLALLRGRAGRQNVCLSVSRPETPIAVEADAEQVRQVLLNLILNAVDVLPHGGEIAIDLNPTAEGQVQVGVEDSGPGISADMLPRLFTPFATNKETGLGLGLVVSRRIVEDHGGKLEAANRPGGGARFVFQLPLSSLPAVSSQQPVNSTPSLLTTGH